MRLGWLVIMVMVFGNFGCANLSKKTIQKQLAQKARGLRPKLLAQVQDADDPESEFAEHQNMARTLREENGASTSSVELSEKDKMYFELSGEKIENISEQRIYERAISKYKLNDDHALLAYSNLLMKRYPHSIYCDNVIYFQGMLFFKNKKFGESLDAFDKILRLYPQGNKAVGALFAKGVLFKKMNLGKEAAKTLANVVNRYPGSPESSQAQIELKVMTQ